MKPAPPDVMSSTPAVSVLLTLSVLPGFRPRDVLHRRTVRRWGRDVSGLLDLGVFLDGNARADQVTVTGRGLDEPDGRPELLLAGPRRGIGCALACIRMRPLVR